MQRYVDNCPLLTTSLLILSKDQANQKAGKSHLNGGLLDDDGEANEDFTEKTAEYINEKLTKVSIPQLSGHEQIQLADIIECASIVERHRRSMDENGARFMLFFRQHALRKGRTNEMHLSWREINWAYHSGSQDMLVDFVSRQHHGSMLWENARESGIFMWLSDASALVSHLLHIFAMWKLTLSRKRSSKPSRRTNTRKATLKIQLTAAFTTLPCARRRSCKACGA
jgi:hypothetical protein